MTAVVVPMLGIDSNDIVRVHCLLVAPGDEVVEGDRLVELLIGEIAFDVHSPASGRFVDFDVDVDDVVIEGSVLGRIEEATQD